MKENLQQWVFVYNPYQEEWQAAMRKDINELWNNSQSKKVLRSKKIQTLENLIIKYGDIDTIISLL
jgi:predicted component of type VI protein secretion system